MVPWPHRRFHGPMAPWPHGFRLRRVTAIGVPNAALSGQADLQRRLRRRHGVDEPLDRPPAFVPEEFFAFQAFAAPRAA